MEIYLPGHRIKSYSHGVKLEEWRITGPYSLNWTKTIYPCSLEHALECYLDKQVRESDCQSIEELKELIIDTKNKIKECVNIAQ